MIVILQLCLYSVAVDFPKFLGIAMETLTTMCDDADVDVRIVADECLNRLIRVSIVLIYIYLPVAVLLVMP